MNQNYSASPPKNDVAVIFLDQCITDGETVATLELASNQGVYVCCICGSCYVHAQRVAR